MNSSIKINYCMDPSLPSKTFRQTEFFWVRYPSMNPLPYDKFLDMNKLKKIADEKLNITKITISLLDRIENTVGKGENAGYQHFLLVLQCFPKPSSLGLLKVGIVW